MPASGSQVKAKEPFTRPYKTTPLHTHIPRTWYSLSIRLIALFQPTRLTWSRLSRWLEKRQRPEPLLAFGGTLGLGLKNLHEAFDRRDCMFRRPLPWDWNRDVFAAAREAESEEVVFGCSALSRLFEVLLFPQGLENAHHLDCFMGSTVSARAAVVFVEHHEVVGLLSRGRGP
eukprot:2207298-Rhodomonas_salina.1